MKKGMNQAVEKKKTIKGEGVNLEPFFPDFFLIQFQTPKLCVWAQDIMIEPKNRQFGQTLIPGWPQKTIFCSKF